MRFAPPRLLTALSIRQALAHKRHRGHRETDQHQRMLDRHNRRCPERPAGDDRGREMVESIPVLSGCDFHTSGGTCVRDFRKALFIEPSSEIRGIICEPTNQAAQPLPQAAEAKCPRPEVASGRLFVFSPLVFSQP